MTDIGKGEAERLSKGSWLDCHLCTQLRTSCSRSSTTRIAGISSLEVKWNFYEKDSSNSEMIRMQACSIFFFNYRGGHQRGLGVAVIRSFVPYCLWQNWPAVSYRRTIWHLVSQTFHKPHFELQFWVLGLGSWREVLYTAERTYYLLHLGISKGLSQISSFVSLANVQFSATRQPYSRS